MGPGIPGKQPKAVDEGIADVSRELRCGAVLLRKASAGAGRLRRSQRMKAYWENWREKKAKK
jgi:hypothetical protein